VYACRCPWQRQQIISNYEVLINLSTEQKESVIFNSTFPWYAQSNYCYLTSKCDLRQAFWLSIFCLICYTNDDQCIRCIYFYVATPTESRTPGRTVRRTVRGWVRVCVREFVRRTQPRTKRRTHGNSDPNSDRPSDRPTDGPTVWTGYKIQRS
jgi:hypothetical protein